MTASGSLPCPLAPAPPAPGKEAAAAAKDAAKGCRAPPFELPTLVPRLPPACSTAIIKVCGGKTVRRRR